VQPGAECELYVVTEEGVIAILELSLTTDSGQIPLKFAVNRMVNLGYAGRDLASVRAHIKELEREGIPAPPSVPMFFPVLKENITTGNHIEVVSEKTSGEAEFVLLLTENGTYVGVGSDHTDRALESKNMLNSKQICPNVLSKEVWDYQDVKGHWDSILIRSWVRPAPDEDEILYQEALLAAILSPPDIIGLVKSKILDGEHNNLVIFSGTVPVLGGQTICGSHFHSALIDPLLKRSLTCTYEIVKLGYLGPLAKSHNSDS